MSKCWIIARRAVMATNNHPYPAEPFIVFQTAEEAAAACDMVEKVSGERPIIVEAALYRNGLRVVDQSQDKP